MLLKKSITHKLFYKKYPYKITSKINNCWLLRHFSVNTVKNYCITGNSLPTRWQPNIDREYLLDFINTFEPYFKQYKLRYERDFFDVYIVEKSDYLKLQDVLKPWMIAVSEPANDEELSFLINQANSKKTVCNELPYKKYRYKVHLRYKTDIEIRENFAKWIANYNSKILAPSKTLEWLEKDHSWHWTPFVYVEDSGTLSMVGLFLGSAVMRVEEFIPKKDINTTL